MDEFIQEVLKPKVIELNAENISKKSGVMLVLGKRGIEGYKVNSKLRTLPGIKFIHPDSNEGKLFADDPTILKADDFFKEKNDSLKYKVDLDYSMISYVSLKKQDDKKNHELKVDSVEEIVEDKPNIITADDYKETESQSLSSNVVPLYQNPRFNTTNSWYSQMPSRGLESKMQYYTPRSFGPSLPVYDVSLKRDDFNPYQGKRKPENLFETFYKKAA